MSVCNYQLYGSKLLVYLYAFLSDADMQTVILILDIGDSGDSNFLYFFTRTVQEPYYSRASVRGTREDS